MIEVQVGEFYLSAGGEIVKIEYNNKDTYYDTSGSYYKYDGTCGGNIREFDLIAHISKELHWNLLYQVKNFHTNGNVRKKLRRKFTNYNNCCISKKEITK